MLSPFHRDPRVTVRMRFDAAPVYNALISLAHLHAAETLADPAPWLVEMAATLSPDQRRRNRLIFDLLGAALLTDAVPPDFPTYLDLLAAERPSALRTRVLRALWPAHGAAPLPEGEELWPLFADPRFLSAHLQANQPPGGPLDAPLLTEAHAWLADPAQMQREIVGHLRACWQEGLASEWAQHASQVIETVGLLAQRPLPAAGPLLVAQAILGHELPTALAAGLEGLTQLIGVPSPHIGPALLRRRGAEIAWLFIPMPRVALGLPVAATRSVTPVRRVELLAPFSALADEKRLHILELVAQQGEMQAQEIIAALALSQSTVSRHLKQLCAAGFLIERRGDGANKCYRFAPQHPHWLFEALSQRLASPAPPDPEAAAPGIAVPEAIARFLDTEGRLVIWPAKRKDQRPVLAYLAAKLDHDRTYTEHEINELLARWQEASDVATLRRELFCEGFVQRTKDGAQYWRAPDR